MTQLQQEMVCDLSYMERDMGTSAPSGCGPNNPNTITWNGTAYPCVASISSFRRELETGGFSKGQLLTATLRILNENGTIQFPTLPQAQQIISYSVDGLQYRIDTVKTDPTGSHFRIVAVCTARGI